MLRIFATALIATFVLCSAMAADTTDLDKMQGKWEVKKTGDGGEKYSQTIEMKKDKMLFKIFNSGGDVVFVATAEVKPQKTGAFKTFTITNIKAGGSEDSLEAANEDRSYVYQLGYNTLTIVSNIDTERDQPPALDVYKRVSK